MTRAITPTEDEAPSSARVHVLQGRPLFFPFPSGSLTYSCEGCPAPCCKGEPLGIGRSRALVTILQAQPRAALFASPGFNGGPLLALSPPPEKCWFLDRKQRCRLEYVLGREHKPTGCRLFPFSILQSAGEALVVIPDLLCPIQVTRPTLNSPHGHDALTLEMVRTQVPRGGHPDLPEPTDMSWDEALPLERRLVAEADARLRSSRAISYLEYLELSHQLTCALVGVDARPSAMAIVEADVRRFFAIDDPLTEDGARVLLTYTGTLRLTASGGVVAPRRTLPARLAALSVLLASSDGMKGTRRSVRSIASLWDAQGPVIAVLAHLGARPLARSHAAIDDIVAQLGPWYAGRPAFHELVAAVRDNGRKSVASTVEELLRAQRDVFAPPLTVDAVSVLHGFGRVLAEGCTFTPI